MDDKTAMHFAKILDEKDARIRELEAELNPCADRWLSVKDKLPDSPKTVLVAFGRADHKAVQTAAYYPDYGTWSMHGQCIAPTHWMQLPEPPKGE